MGIASTAPAAASISAPDGAILKASGKSNSYTTTLDKGSYVAMTEDGGLILLPDVATYYNGNPGVKAYGPASISGRFFGNGTATNGASSYLPTGRLFEMGVSGNVTIEGPWSSPGPVPGLSDWTQQLSTTISDIRPVWNGTKWVVAQNGKTYHSIDSLAWTTYASPISAYKMFTYSGGIYYISQGNTAQTYYTSTDAITWTTRTLPTVGGNSVFYPYSVTKIGSTWVMQTRNSQLGPWQNNSWTSTDGLSFTMPDTNQGITNNQNSPTDAMMHMTSSGTTAVTCYARTDGNYSFIHYSTNGTSWTQGPQAATSMGWSGVHYINNLFFAVQTGYTAAFSGTTTGTLWYSSTGTSWTQATIAGAVVGDIIQSITWDGTKYWLWIYNYGGYKATYTSTDGITWTVLVPKSAAAFSSTAVVYGNGNFVSKEITSSPNGLNGPVEFSLFKYHNNISS